MNLSFESVNKEIEELDLASLTVPTAQEDAGAITSQLCNIWKKVGGIIRLIANLPILPKKWRDALNILISALDSLCP